KNVAPSKIVQPNSEVEGQVLEVDAHKRRISLGLKERRENPGEEPAREHPVGSTVGGGVQAITEVGLFIGLGEGHDGSGDFPERFGKGDKIDAMVTAIDKGARKISLSIKAREISDEKEAVAQYGSSDSGASLGDILGAALKRRTKKGEKEEDADGEG